MVKATKLSSGLLDKYRRLSPFVLKDILITEARASRSRVVPHLINVGRGNPNFLCTIPREAFSLFQVFAVGLSETLLKHDSDSVTNPSLGIYPLPSNAPKLNAALNAALGRAERGVPALRRASHFLRSALVHMHSIVGGDFNLLLQQACVAALGSFYPTPPRILPFAHSVLNYYLNRIILSGGQQKHSRSLQLFATEGATAAIVYVFKTLRINGILNAGDKVAVVTPIFSPYWELPQLHIFGLTSVYIRGSEKHNWAIPLSQLDKLRDPAIKCVFAVNPTNPMAVSMSRRHVEAIGKIARERNATPHPLLIVADSVYAPFVTQYYSLLQAAPRNTIEIYSFSKYFGVTGWRMGVVALSPTNIIDSHILPNLSARLKKQLNARYGMTSLHPEKMLFIDRLLNDSRDVAFSHTAGLATPQQFLMCLFALYDMTHPRYKRDVHTLLRQRDALLYSHLPIQRPVGGRETDYYALLNILELTRGAFGDEAAARLKRESHPLDFVFQMARAYRTVVLPGAGFLGPNWTFRVSLANSATQNYGLISRFIIASIRDLLQ